MDKLNVTKTIGSYNGRRYGTPWLARITAFAGRPELAFERGAYNGNDNGGEIYFAAEVGEVVKIGQKDYRGNNTDNDFWLVNSDGSLSIIADPVEARKAWQTWQTCRNNPPSDEVG